MDSIQNTQYSSTSGMTDYEMLAVLFMVFVAIIIISIIGYIVGSIFLGLIFKKAGVPAWKAWVPIYNYWITYQLGGQPGFWALLMLVPGINIVALVFYYMAAYQIGLKLQKDGWFVILAIFVPLIWLIWLGIDSSTWQDDGEGVVSTPVVS